MADLDEPLKEEETKAETSWQWWTDYKGESFSPHVMLYGPNGTRMLGNGVAIALELTRLEAEVKALKPLAELGQSLAKIDVVKFRNFIGWIEAETDAPKAVIALCMLADARARYDSALKAQGEQANPSEEER